MQWISDLFCQILQFCGQKKTSDTTTIHAQSKPMIVIKLALFTHEKVIFSTSIPITERELRFFNFIAFEVFFQPGWNEMI
jgi:hypothetical protein